jgi:hypothetical protein
VIGAGDGTREVAIALREASAAVRTDVAQGEDLIFASASEQADILSQHLHLVGLALADTAGTADGVPVLA